MSLKHSSLDLTLDLLRAAGRGFGVIYGRGFRGKAQIIGGEDVRLQALNRGRRAVLRRVQDLKRMKLLEIRRIGKRLEYSLTNKGEIASLALQIRAAAVSDDFITTVAFDIPESHRGARQMLRRFLKNSGFMMMQLSVWESGKAVRGLLRKWVAKNGLGSWVRVHSTVE